MRLKFSLFCFFIVGLVSSLPAHATYKCVDEKGVTHYGDIVPPQCAKKEITEFSNAGGLVRKYDAPLTPEQLKAREDERSRQAEMQLRVSGQKQKDLALLATYGSEREFDGQRERDILQLDSRINTLKLRVEEVDTQSLKLKSEMQFYENDAGKGAKSSGSNGAKSAKAVEIPERLTQAMMRSNADKAGLEEEMAKVDIDKVAVTARYDADKARWKQLKSGMQPGTLVGIGIGSGNTPSSAPAGTTADKRVTPR